jgi:sigma-B regulation protein RsbU (phosphoserine phosphatase)
MIALNTLLQKKELSLGALLEITQAINNNMPEDHLYRIYHFILRGNLSLQKMALWVNDFGNWYCKTHFGTKNLVATLDFERFLPEAPQNVLPVQESVFAETFNEFEWVIPVFHKGNSLAFLFASASKNNEMDTDFIRTLTNILIVAIENKKLAQKQLEQEVFRKELDIAARVQQRLCPTNLPQTEKLQISAYYAPHFTVGGDYYDFIPLGKEKFLFCIADVSGKGIAAAMMMANFQASLRTITRQTQNLRDIVAELNYLVLQNAQGENFITFFVATYDYQSYLLHYINAGHNPPFLMANGHLQRLEQGTTVLGIFDPLPFVAEAQMILKEESLIFAYTDGLSEAANAQDELFGDERIALLLKKWAYYPLEKLHSEFILALNDFRKETPLQDDITMISCKILP